MESGDYFESYQNLEVHRLMLEDQPRTNAYREAICNAPEVFKGKVVMDVGAGSGILSLFCAKAGAKKVYAVEASSLAEVLPHVALANDFRDVIEVIHRRVEDISADIKVDIIVSEWMGFYLLHESMLDSVIVARDKFLKPEGLMFPSKAQLFAAPCKCPDLWEKARQFWVEPKYEFDLSPLLMHAIAQTSPEITVIPMDGLLSDPQLLLDLDLKTVNLDTLLTIKDRRFFCLEATAPFHGVGFWFTCEFPKAEDVEDAIELSTAPWEEETHWKQTVVLMPSEVNVEEGDIFGWEIDLTKANTSTRSYNISLKILDDDEPHPVPCSCGTAKCEIIAHLIKKSENDVDSEIDRLDDSAARDIS